MRETASYSAVCELCGVVARRVLIPGGNCIARWHERDAPRRRPRPAVAGRVWSSWRRRAVSVDWLDEGWQSRLDLRRSSIKQFWQRRRRLFSPPFSDSVCAAVSLLAPPSLSVNGIDRTVESSRVHAVIQSLHAAMRSNYWLTTACQTVDVYAPGTLQLGHPTVQSSGISTNALQLDVRTAELMFPDRPTACSCRHLCVVQRRKLSLNARSLYSIIVLKTVSA